jgi:hypothetical protein
MPFLDHVLTHRLRVRPFLEYSDLVRRIRNFTVSDFLKVANRTSLWIDETGLTKTLTAVPQSTKYRVVPGSAVYIGPWTIAFLAKTAILHSSENMHRWLKAEDIVCLAYMYENLKDAGSDERIDSLDKAYGLLVRLRSEQVGYQEAKYNVIPRAKLMFIDAPRLVARPPFDLESMWLAESGMTIEKFMAVGFAYFAGALQFSQMDRYFPASGVMKDKISQEECDLFLKRVAASYNEFRELSAANSADDPMYIKSEFNVLLQRPLIIGPRREGMLCPVPHLIPPRITEGIFHDIANSLTRQQRNQFFSFFGYIFEEYVGILLRSMYGDAVIHEPSYIRGRQHQEGPDWIVFEEDTAILFECRSSRLALDTRIYGDIEGIKSDFQRMFIRTLKKYPQKIQELRDGLTPVDINGITQFRAVVVLYDRVAFERLYRDIADSELARDGMPTFDYSLMDISDLEVLAGWCPEVSMRSILDGALQAYLNTEADFGDYLRSFASVNNLQMNNKLFDNILNDFFSDEYGIKDRRSRNVPP